MVLELALIIKSLWSITLTKLGCVANIQFASAAAAAAAAAAVL